MTPAAWKVIALSLAALLLLTVGLLIGTNLGDGDETAQPSAAPTVATTATTASTTTSTSTTTPAPTTTSVPAVQRLGNRFGWCAELQDSWDVLDADIAGKDSAAVAAAAADEVVRAFGEGEEPTGIAQVLLDGSPKQPTKEMAGTVQGSVTERAWMAFLDAASPETLAAVEALASAAEAHAASTADFEAARAAAVSDSEDSLSAYGAATARALA